jgi:hypothetical protein
MKKELSPKQREELLGALKERFEKNMNRHKGLEWAKLEKRKENKPENTVIDMAAALGVEVLTEEEYLELQKLGNFDAKTSSWLKTPSDIRNLGGAISGDFRFGRVFVGHNGADSYYAARGFRGSLRV